jgi:hypothetical protein
MSFPDKQDRELLNRAADIKRFAGGLKAWMAQFADVRKQNDIAPLATADQLTAWQLERNACSLLESAKHPVATAIYGPSQAGKSLMIGQVLTAADKERSPLGRNEAAGSPAYLPSLSFDIDLNPQNGSNEATAMVTRFSTTDRLPADLPAEYPVMARALRRGQLLCVLARGFAMECASRGQTCTRESITAAVTDLSRRYPGAKTDPMWQNDLLDAFAYMKQCDPRCFTASCEEFMSALVEQPLSSEGCVELAARLFWDGWRSLTGLFLRLDEYLQSIASPHHEPGLMVSWSAVRFLLDSKRSMVHQRAASRCFDRVAWADFRTVRRDDWLALEHCPETNAYREPLEIIQAALLELVIPVLPQRLRDDWRGVLEQCDLLDIPGLRAGRQGAEQGKRTSADTLDEQLEIVKRGKVAYLFEHYTQQQQIQSLVLLVRGGNLEVTGELKHHVDLWGRGRYGADHWPNSVPAGLPALFIGLTGIDEEFRQRNEFAEPALYDARLTQLADALGPVLKQFGGSNKTFTNIYPLRYPGTWDADTQQRQREGSAKWDRAGQAFLTSASVGRYVGQAAIRWDASLRDGDGGLSLLSAGLREVTTASAKQVRLASCLDQARLQLLDVTQRWLVKADGQFERMQRLECAEQVLDWLTADPRLIHDRVAALKQSLSIAEGEQAPLSAARADDTNSERRFSSLEHYVDALREFLDHWATRVVADKWSQITKSHLGRGTWLTLDVLRKLSSYLRDYFCLPAVFEPLSQRLWNVMSMRFRDEGARREARHRYVRLILNDLILNPGLDEGEPDRAARDDTDRFGSMTSWVVRWRLRLPEALAAGAGAIKQIPPGNDELQQLLATLSSV